MLKKTINISLLVIFLFYLNVEVVIAKDAYETVTIEFKNDCKGKGLNGCLWMQEFENIRKVERIVRKYDPPINLNNVSNNHELYSDVKVLKGIINFYKGGDSEKLIKLVGIPALKARYKFLFSRMSRRLSSYQDIFLELSFEEGGKSVYLINGIWKNNVNVEYIILEKENDNYFLSGSTVKSESVFVNYIISSYTTKNYKYIRQSK